jgi:hypothetical protein
VDCRYKAEAGEDPAGVEEELKLRVGGARRNLENVVETGSAEGDGSVCVKDSEGDLAFGSGLRGRAMDSGAAEAVAAVGAVVVVVVVVVVIVDAVVVSVVAVDLAATAPGGVVKVVAGAVAGTGVERSDVAGLAVPVVHGFCNCGVPRALHEVDAAGDSRGPAWVVIVWRSWAGGDSAERRASSGAAGETGETGVGGPK